MAKEEPAKGSGPVLRYSKSYRYAVKQHERMEKQQINSDSGAAASTDTTEQREERPVPIGYVCNRCGHSDHWYWNCPTMDDPDHVRKVRTAKGIPRWYLTKVKDVEEAQARSLGGVTLVIPGNLTHYVWTHNPDKQEHRDRVGDTIQEKVVTAFSDGAKQVEESLKCPLCRRLFRSAVLAPCCGASFCSECAIERLCHNGTSDSCCPKCKKELLAHQLVPNQDLRNQIDAVLRASTGKKHIEEKLQVDTIQITRKRVKNVEYVPPAPETASLPSDTHSRLVLSLRSKLRAIPQHHIQPTDAAEHHIQPTDAAEHHINPADTAAQHYIQPANPADTAAQHYIQPTNPEDAAAPHMQPTNPEDAAAEHGAECACVAPDVMPIESRSPDLAPPPILMDQDPFDAEWAEAIDFLSLPPTPNDDEISLPTNDEVSTEVEVIEVDSQVERSRKRRASAEESSAKRLCSGKTPAGPMSRKEFKRCQQAWETYNEKLARKEQRRTNREERKLERAKKNEKIRNIRR